MQNDINNIDEIQSINENKIKKINKQTKYGKNIRLTPGQIIILGFLAVILIGTFFLMLPISLNPGKEINFLDALFTATSAVCVTGLVVVDTSLQWSVFGKTIIIMLIQIGGLGFMSIGVFFAIIFGKKISLRNRILIKESLNQSEYSGLVRLVRSLLAMTFLIEGVGAALLSAVFIPKFGFWRGLGYSIFHSISAFCNAGFDLMGSTSGKFSSLVFYYDNPIVMVTIISLIVLGGIGFTVMINFKTKRKFKLLDLHSKIVITTTVVLIVLGTILLIVNEWNNPSTIGNMHPVDRFMNALFQSVTTRTAGFATIDLQQLSEQSTFIMIILMFIGASPASTGGGIKTTTIAVLFLIVKTFLYNKDEVYVYNKKIGRFVIIKAVSVFLMGLMLLVTATYLLTLLEPSFDLKSAIFEVSSALATVGLSLKGTSLMGDGGRIVIICCMFLGRVGSLTIFAAFIGKAKTSKVKYPKGDVLIG